MQRTARAYIDGHNFYHGAMKDSPEYKWLDLAALCEHLLSRKGGWSMSTTTPLEWWISGIRLRASDRTSTSTLYSPPAYR
jgi:hypothetical protein